MFGNASQLRYFYLSVDENSRAPWNDGHFILDAGGNIGIGTVSPQEKLDVNDGSATADSFILQSKATPPSPKEGEFWLTASNEFMLREDGEDVQIDVRPVSGTTTSPLRILIGGVAHSIELVALDSPLATKARINTPNDGIRAFSRLSSLSGRFICRKNPPKHDWRWIISITCLAADGSHHTFGTPRGWSDHLSKAVWDKVYNDINSGSRTAPVELPSRSIFEALRSETGGASSGIDWKNDGTPDQDTLNGVCRIFGHESYTSYTIRDGQTKAPYRNGKAQWHSPHDNYTCYFIPDE
jgi:hypothetical protein